jgi:flagellin
VIQGVTLGQGGSVDITDNAVSRALKLTTSGDVNQQGTAAQDLKLNVDGIGELDVNVSSCTNLTGIAGTGLAATINAAVTAAGGTYGSYGSVASATTDANSNGTITLASTATGAAASSVQVIDNAVSEALKFTAGTVTGKDPTKLDLNVDGLGQVAVNLSTLGTTGTLTDVANAINVAVAAAGHGYNGTYDSVAAAHAGTGSTGYLSLSGVSVGGSLSVTNNGMSKALGLVTGTADTNISGAAQTLNVQMDGKAQLKIDLSSLGNSAKLSDIAAKINTALVADTADYGAAYANAAQANPDGSITLTGVQGGGTLTVNNSAVSNTLGLTANTSNASNTGTAVQTLGISIDGKATTQISLAGIAGGKTPTLQDIADAINTQLTNDANYGASYANAQANSDGTITIASKGTGSAGGSVTVYNSAAGKALGLISGTAPSATMTGKDESVADAVSFLNTTAQQALGTSTDAQIVSLDSSGNVTISSQTTGKNSSVEVLSSGTTGGLNAALNLTGSVDKTTSGTARSLQSVVDSLKTAFNGNTTLQEAGLTAGINQGALEISSSNGTEFRADAWGTKVGSDLGFGTTGTAFNGANALTPKSTASTVDTQGASAIGTFANTKNSASISFQNMQFGNDDQSLTITANSAAGVAQTPLTVTLQNDDKAQTGANIDAAINTINTKLQQSESTTMRSITAVRETGADGSESINLISSLSSFNVSVSSSAGAAVGDGLNGGNATTLASAMNGTSSSIAIDTQAGAQQAVVALAAAVAKLGSAQASIGRGENQLGYAINLAQSQITNFSSAESQIRDTNVAQQAANLSKAQVLSQAAIAAMAQANSAPQGVLALLRG